MRTRKFLSRALSVLLSGAMLVGAIPAAFAEDYDFSPLEAQTQTAGIEGHTLDGYFCVWSEDFESEDEKLPSGFSTLDWNHDKNTWAKAYGSAGDFTAHHGLGCVYSQSYDSEKGALSPLDTLVLPECYLSGAYDWKLTFMAAGTGDNNAEEFTLSYNLDGEAGWESLSSNFTTTGEWQEYTYDLNRFVGHTVKLGIKHYDCTNQYALRVDCINLWAKSVHSAEGYPINDFFDDFEGDIRPTYYLSEAEMWAPTETTASHHGFKCLESLPEGKEIGVSGSNTLIMDSIALGIDKNYALSFMVKGVNAGTLQVSVVTGDGKMHQLLSQTVDTNEWQQVTVDLEGFAGRTVDIHINQRANEADSMYIDCLGLWYKFAHFYGDGRTLVWSEDFESSTLPDYWETLEYDGNGYNWEVEYQDSDIKKHHGIGSVYSESSNSYLGDELPTNNWLLLPRQTLSGGKRYILTFEAVEQADADKNLAEKFGVFISTDGGANYTQLGEDYTTTSEWQEIEVNLSAYAGKTVDIAVVHHNCINQYRLVLDCFNLWELPIGQITTIQANIAEPKIGDTPATTATFTTTPAGGLADSTGVYWQKVAEADFKGQETTGWTDLEEDEKFEGGYYYLVNMPLELNPGYKFASTVTSKVNDYTAEGSYDGTYPSIWVLIPPIKIEITNIAATITEPEIGAAPDFDPVVTFDPENSAYVDYVYWSKIAKADYTGTSDDEWLAMGATEKFEAGYIYGVEIYMSTEDGYKVGGKCTGTINGKPHDDYWGPFIDDPYAPYLFMRFEPQAEVKSIIATVTPPTIGEKPDFNPVITFNPANSLTVGSIKWNRIAKEDYTGTYKDSWDGIDPDSDTVFEAGYIYSIDMCFNLADGFMITPATVGTVNGKPHVDTYGGLDDGSGNAYLCLEFDPEVPNPVATAGDGQVTLSWNAVPGATAYYIYSYLGDGQYTLLAVTSDLSYTVTGLTNGQEYQFLVRSFNGENGSPYDLSDLVPATPQAKGLAKPVVTAAPGNGQVTLSWAAIPSATTYYIYSYLGDGQYALLGVTSDLSFTAAGLTNGQTYQFLVRAFSATEGSPYDLSDLVPATPQSKGLAKPVVTAAPGNGQVTLSWAAIPSATTYYIYSYLGDGNYALIGVTGDLSFTATGLTNGQNYQFLVRAFNDTDASPYELADLVSATPQAKGLAKPVVTATPGDGQVTLSWAAIPSATTYYIYSYLGDGQYALLGVTSDLSFTAAGLTNGQTYQFLVRAFNATDASPYELADLVSATPQAKGLAKPVVTATPGNGEVTLSWKAIPSATTYYIYSYLGDGQYALLGVTSDLSFTAAGLTNGQTYQFLVRAFNDTDASPYELGDLVSATPQSKGLGKPVLDITVGDGAVYLSWSVVPDATLYYVYFYNSSTDGFDLYGVTTGNGCYVGGLVNGQTYGYLVRAFNDYEGSPYSYADIVFVTPPYKLAKPNVTATPGSGQVTLSWTAIPSAATYYIYSYLGDGQYALLGVTSDLSFTAAGLTSGKTYQFLVRAFSDSDASPYELGDLVSATPA